jgi:heterotetrameric sarcosine oxidase gamma subunit
VAESILTPTSALAGILAAGRHGRPDGPPGLTICERAHVSLVSVLARKGQAAPLAALVKSAYGIALPSSPRLAEGPMPDGRSLSFIWSGPDQWLAYAEGAPALEGELAMALGRRAMVADQSDGRCVLRLSGPKTRQVLAKGISLDLDPRIFKPGDVALTMAAHIAVQIWQIDTRPSFEIAMFRSLAGSFWHWLSASAAEFGYEVVEDR